MCCLGWESEWRVLVFVDLWGGHRVFCMPCGMSSGTPGDVQNSEKSEKYYLMWDTFPFPICFCVICFETRGFLKVVNCTYFSQVIYTRGKIWDARDFPLYPFATKLSRVSTCLTKGSKLHIQFMAVAKTAVEVAEGSVQPVVGSWLLDGTVVWKWFHVHMCLDFSTTTCTSLSFNTSVSIFRK